jgi:hypothetical protein
MMVSAEPRMRIDPYTKEAYDANLWYRGVNGLWVNIEAEKRYAKECEERFMARWNKRNASRKTHGRRRLSQRAFSRGCERYQQFLREDSGLSFGEWLRNGGYKPLSERWLMKKGGEW